MNVLHIIWLGEIFQRVEWYHESFQDQSGKDQKTLIRVHSFRNGSAAGVQRASHFVYPCLKLVEDSYLFVYLKNSKYLEFP